MQVLFDNTKTGELVVQIDSLDDLWVLYNIIKPEDRIKGRTFRRVVIREGDAGERKPMVLAINVENVEFHEFTNRLRVLGSIFEGPEDWVAIGQHHTFNLEPGDKITIFKDQWYKNDIQRIRKNLQRKENNMVIVVAIETGLASITLLSNYSLTPITEIKENIPGKRYKDQDHKGAMENFYNQVALMIDETIQKYPVNLLVLCGPGFNKEQFAQIYRDRLTATKKTIEIRTLNASSGELSGVYEVLRNGSVAALKSDFKIAQEEVIMSEFVERLGKDNSTVVYGLKETHLASQMGAVEKLLICDKLLRTADNQTRAQIEEALNDTEKQRGEVFILNSANPAGDQLSSYGQIAGLLRFKVNFDEQ
jgi:protein pelota